MCCMRTVDWRPLVLAASAFRRAIRRGRLGDNLIDLCARAMHREGGTAISIMSKLAKFRAPSEPARLEPARIKLRAIVLAPSAVCSNRPVGCVAPAGCCENLHQRIPPGRVADRASGRSIDRSDWPPKSRPARKRLGCSPCALPASLNIPNWRPDCTATMSHNQVNKVSLRPGPAPADNYYQFSRALARAARCSERWSRSSCHFQRLLERRPAPPPPPAKTTTKFARAPLQLNWMQITRAEGELELALISGSKAKLISECVRARSLQSSPWRRRASSQARKSRQQLRRPGAGRRPAGAELARPDRSRPTWVVYHQIVR